MGPTGCLDLSIGILRSSIGDPEEQAVLRPANHSRPRSEELMHAYSCSFSCSLSQSDLLQTRRVMEERSQAQERPWDTAGSYLGGSSGQEHPLVGKVNPRKSSWWQYSLYSEPGSSSCQTMSFWRSCRRQRTPPGAATLEEVLWRNRQAGVHRQPGNPGHDQLRERNCSIHTDNLPSKSQSNPLVCLRGALSSQQSKLEMGGVPWAKLLGSSLWWTFGVQYLPTKSFLIVTPSFWASVHPSLRWGLYWRPRDK